MEYKQYIINGFNKALKDELSAASVYLAMANVTTEDGLASELIQHANEEFEHYSKLVKYIYKHNLQNEITFTVESTVMNTVPTDTEEILKHVQQLETNAIYDYNALVLRAREENDIETEEFFKELMLAEQEHFDDLVTFTGANRSLNSIADIAPEIKSFEESYIFHLLKIQTV